MPKDLNEVLKKGLDVWATEFTREIRANLVSKDAWFDESTLAESITVLPVKETADGYLIRIQMPDYARYVDQGRQPTRNRSRSLGLTVQKRLTGGEGWISHRGLPVPMVIEIKKNGQPVLNKDGSKRVKRFKNINEANRSLSFAISQKIHKHGYKSKGYGFYSEIFNDGALTELSKRLEPLLGEQIEVQLIEGVE